MNFTTILILGILVSFIGFFAIYSASPKRFELKIIDNELIVIVYSTYFFLPFTTKIKQYKNIKEAQIRKRMVQNKHSKYFVYDLILQFSRRSIVLLRGKTEYRELSDHCDNINQAIVSFEEYSFDICSGKWRTFLICVMVIVPLIIILFYTTAEDFNYAQNIEFQYFTYVYLLTITIIILSIILSLTINRLIESKNKTNVISSLNYSAGKNIKEKNRDMDSEAQRIYDSIVK
ncbi:MAG: hypothetical protein J6T23_05025 [Elusimicrobia bacterium]|nr:hypothetical protein [Elusimicrobiota bacterium]